MKNTVKSALCFTAAGLALLGFSQIASASCSPEPYTGSICYTAATYCPADNYMEAAGQTLTINQYSALYSLIGFQYGGDQKTNFQLPDLRGRAVVGAGQGANLPVFIPQGTVRGQETVKLTVGQLPSHSHALTATTTSGTTATPTADYQLAAPVTPAPKMFGKVDANQVTLASGGATGGGQDVSVLSPQIALKACIAVNGYYPPRP